MLVSYYSHPGGYEKRTSLCSIKIISTSISEEREWGNRHWTWTHMCRFCLYDIIWSVYLFLLLRPMHINTELFVLWQCEDLNFKFSVPRIPPLLAITFQTQRLEVTSRRRARPTSKAGDTAINRTATRITTVKVATATATCTRHKTYKTNIGINLFGKNLLLQNYTQDAYLFKRSFILSDFYFLSPIYVMEPPPDAQWRKRHKAGKKKGLRKRNMGLVYCYLVCTNPPTTSPLSCASCLTCLRLWLSGQEVQWGALPPSPPGTHMPF